MKPGLLQDITFLDDEQYPINDLASAQALIKLYRKYVEKTRPLLFDHELRNLKHELTPSYNHPPLVHLYGKAGCGKSQLALWMVSNAFNMYPDDVIAWAGEEPEGWISTMAENFGCRATIKNLGWVDQLEAIQREKPSMVVIDITSFDWRKRAELARGLRNILDSNRDRNVLRAILTIEQHWAGTSSRSTLEHAHVAYEIGDGKFTTVKNRWASAGAVYTEIPNRIYEVVNSNRVPA